LTEINLFQAIPAVAAACKQTWCGGRNLLFSRGIYLPVVSATSRVTKRAPPTGSRSYAFSSEDSDAGKWVPQ